LNDIHKTKLKALSLNVITVTKQTAFLEILKVTNPLMLLVAAHDIQLSLRQLKRILLRKGLRRQKNHSDPEVIVAAVEQELKKSGSLLGYRQMHQKLRLDHGLVVSRETVRTTLASLDPEGVSLCSRHRLKRCKYTARGPNYVWHLDGYDKLKLFGFCVHGAIDGFSRRIMWLEVDHTNNNPHMIASYFHDCIKQLGGVPWKCRSDAGTENVHVAAMQRFFRHNANDEFSGEKSFQYGRLTSNQRIECWWSYLKKSETNWWINYFKDLRDQGLYDDSNPIHCECLKFCYMTLLRKELHRVAKNWNLHKIRPSTVNEQSPHGRPDMIYFVPEAFNAISYLQVVSQEDLEVAKEICCDVPQNDFAETFSELAQLIITEHNLPVEVCDVSQAERLYIDLLGFLENII
jgi:hypothetical protein